MSVEAQPFTIDENGFEHKPKPIKITDGDFTIIDLDGAQLRVKCRSNNEPNTVSLTVSKAFDERDVHSLLIDPEGEDDISIDKLRQGLDFSYPQRILILPTDFSKGVELITHQK